MKLKKITFTSTILLILCLTSRPQSLSAQNVLTCYGPESRFVLSGEGTFTTYGAGISFPVLLDRGTSEDDTAFWVDVAEFCC